MNILWQRYQDSLYYHKDLGLYLDVSRMQLNPQLLATLKPKFVKAFQDMEALEGGAIANPDEQRMVRHYWLRTPELAPSAELKQEITVVINLLLFSRYLQQLVMESLGKEKDLDGNTVHQGITGD